MPDLSHDAIALLNYLAGAAGTFYGSASPGESAALAQIETLSAELGAAARALEQAADAIRFGKATPQVALKTHQAAQRAKNAAEGIQGQGS